MDDHDQQAALLDLAEVLTRLRRVLKEDAISSWLSTPQAALNGESPLQRILRGEGDDVKRLVGALEVPTFT